MAAFCDLLMFQRLAPLTRTGAALSHGLRAWLCIVLLSEHIHVMDSHAYKSYSNTSCNQD